MSRSRCLAVLAAALPLAAAGCSGDRDGLVVATTWSPAERRALEDEYRAWAAGHRDEAPPRIAWVGLDPRDDLDRAAARIGGVDAVLGGVVGGDGAVVARRSAIGLAARPGTEGTPTTWDALGEPSSLGRVAIDDPRDDPATLALATARLRALGWSKGYAWLVRLAANARPIGRGRGATIAAVGRGEADWALVDEAQAEGWGFTTLDEAIIWDESARPLLRARPAENFARFLRERPKEEALAPALSRRQRVEWRPAGEVGRATNPLLRDLLGATLVDEQDELRTAWEAVLKAGRPADWEARLMVAPPWPPASVTRLVRRHAASGEDPRPWVETLAGQVVADPLARAWLLLSWEEDPRPIDGRFLDELAAAADGRLVAEERFRAWLRAEWTAWAGQRYRWVARHAGGPPP